MDIAGNGFIRIKPAVATIPSLGEMQASIPPKVQTRNYGTISSKFTLETSEFIWFGYSA